jgi:hypothetical protein
MDTSRLEDIVRSLAATPSRRAVSRALLGLSVGTFLEPLLRLSDAEARNGKKTHKHKHNRKKKRKKNLPDRCPGGGQEYCDAGEYSECCSNAVDPESGNPYEFCTDCGCCAYGKAKCCPSAGDGLCCDSDAKCCYSDDFKESACCGPNDKCCGAACCDGGEECCKTTGDNPYYYCCAQGLTCKPSGGNTCMAK